LLLPTTGCKWISAVSHGGRGYSEKLLCHTDPGKVTLSLFSPDRRHVAQVVKVGEKLAIAVDSKIGQSFDDIEGKSLIFSPDSKRLAYAAENDGKWTVVLDGAAGKLYETIRKPGIIFSPDSKRVAYAVQDRGRCFVVVDGVNGPGYDVVFDPVFSPDSRGLAYGALEFGQLKMFLVLDGQNEKGFDLTPYFHPNASFGIGGLTFSPDSKRVAYVAELGGKRTFVVDGQGAGPFDAVRSVLFSPDSRRVAYTAQLHQDSWEVVVDGKAEGPYLLIRDGSLAFSPDSRRVGYIAETTFGHFLVNDRNVVVGEVHEKQAVVIDGKQGKAYDYIWSLTFSPDSQRVAWHAQADGKHFIVVDGEEKERWDNIDSGPVFGPDSHQIAYAARVGASVHLVVDGKDRKTDSKNYKQIGGLLFSPDGRRVAFMADDGAKQFVVVDESQGKPYGAIPDAAIIFDSPKSLHYAALKKAEPGVDLIVVEEVFF
jgi:Tol biopolymer transport system component